MLLGVFLVALLVRVVAALPFTGPAYADSFYYVSVARQLAAGAGYTIDYIWNFVDVGGRLPAVGQLPIPAGAHWMPLGVLVQVPFILLLGDHALAYSLPFWLVGALVAPLVVVIARDAGLPRTTVVGGAVLSVAPLGVLPFLTQPDNFALYMLLGALALWLCARGAAGDGRAFLLGGLIVGLATLSRNDGVLLGLPFALTFLAGRWRIWRDRGDDHRPAIGWGAAFGCFAIFLIVVAPWYARQLEVFGSLSPSAASGRILFIQSYRELYSVTTETTLGSFLSQGPGPILASRLQGLVDAVKWFAVVPFLVYLVPFGVIGFWHHRRATWSRPWAVYLVALFAFSALVSAYHVDHGTFLHSAVALVPHGYLLAFEGIRVAVVAAARRLQHWEPGRATRNFTVMALGVSLVGSVGATIKATGGWRDVQDSREAIAAYLRARPAEERVMSPEPGAYHHLAARSGIVTPDDPLPVVEQAMRLYDVRWLVLERDYTTEALAPVLLGEAEPSWLSDPLVLIPGGTAGGQDPAPAPGSPVPARLRAPRAVLFAVCFQPGDDRCDR
ncbi:MAG TPA: glycosyltransferase family 39 protein [Candidatus Limnocylindrales bacterium]|nr:glycosyltransferase family 39 protein [Candidatus Limnocylindrales bacterium]